MTKEDIIKKLYSLLDLEKNWDSYGAVPPNIKFIEKARDFIIKYSKIPEYVFSGVNGEILIVYLSNDLRYECEIYFDESTQLLVSDENYKISDPEFFPYDGEVDTSILDKYLGE
jgi:hypothetical protein